MTPLVLSCNLTYLSSRVAEALILGTMMVGQAVAFAPNYSKARVAASQIFALLDRQPAIDTSPGVGLRLVSTIVLQVTFHSLIPMLPCLVILMTQPAVFLHPCARYPAIFT